MRGGSVLVFVVLALLVTYALAVRVSGGAKVVDGDSLELGTTSIRLYGVDAPEALQTCGEGAMTWNCGRAATDKLRGLIGRNQVTCQEKDTDSYGRTVAVCTAGGRDLGKEMVEAGLALAYRRYSDDYVDEENRARAARRGMWAGTFTPPWEFRRERDESPTRSSRPGAAEARPPAEPPARRPGCNIKGNINSEGEKIYHVPGSRSFDDTVIDESRGERWFCSEAEARRVGWRAPRG